MKKILFAAIGLCFAAWGTPSLRIMPLGDSITRGDEAKSRVLDLVGPTDAPRFLALCRASLKPHPWHDIQGTCGRDDACECRSCWVRRGGYNAPPNASSQGASDERGMTRI